MLLETGSPSSTKHAHRIAWLSRAGLTSRRTGTRNPTARMPNSLSARDEVSRDEPGDEPGEESGPNQQ